jgi:hypothetical protein
MTFYNFFKKAELIIFRRSFCISKRVGSKNRSHLMFKTNLFKYEPVFYSGSISSNASLQIETASLISSKEIVSGGLK